MCGIIGFCGNEAAAPLLLEGLTRLEYRGYDSAGLALSGVEGIEVVKSKGRLGVLKEKVAQVTAEGGLPPYFSGIGHTRWATHGEPNDVNSHPHLSASERVAVVHNGIIENYAELKERLIRKGYEFKSETDTEVIANLIDYYYKGEIVETLAKALTKLEGSYALGVLCKDNPEQITAVRKDSPLIAAYCEKGAFMASDVTALLPYTRDFYEIGENEIVTLTKDKVTFYDADGETLTKETFRADWDEFAASKGGFPHFMLKEIFEQPKALRDTIGTKIKNGEVFFGTGKKDFQMTAEEIRCIDKFYVTACGSANYAGIVGTSAIERLTGINAAAELASEFRYREPIIGENSLVVVISQSGETLDSLMALKYAKAKGAKTLAVVNVLGSAIAKAADYVIYTNAGPEISVATTKAYSCQLAVLYLLSVYLGRKLGVLDDARNKELIEALLSLPAKVEASLDNKGAAQYLADRFFNESDVFFIGRGLDYAAALEASLKLKEIAYIHSEAYAAGELKHGAIALVERGTLVIAVAAGKELFDKTASNIAEVKSRGAATAIVTWEDNKKADCADCKIFVPETEKLFMPSLTIIPLQLFAYYTATAKGLDIDKPRNLAKSVTVE